MAAIPVTGLKKITGEPVGTVTGSGTVEISATDSAGTEKGSVSGGVISFADSSILINGEALTDLLAEQDLDVVIIKAGTATAIGTINGSGQVEISALDESLNEVPVQIFDGVMYIDSSQISVGGQLYLGLEPTIDLNIIIYYDDGTVAPVSIILGKVVVPKGTCENGTVNLLDDDGNNIGTVSVASGGTENETVTNSIVNVRKFDGTLIQAVSVLAEGSEDYPLINNIITVNGAGYKNIQATESFNILLVDNADGTTPVTPIVDGDKLRVNLGGTSAISYQRGMWRLNATSYTNYDTNWLLNNTAYLNNSVVGEAVLLDPQDSSLLLTQNEKGNFLRETNSLGGTVNDGSDGSIAGYRIDHLTGYGFLLDDANLDGLTLQGAFSAIDSRTDKGFSDWFCINRGIVESIIDGDGGTTIFESIQNWGAPLIWLADTTSATNGVYWNRGNSLGSQQYIGRAMSAATAAIGCVLVRKHYN